MTATTEKTTTPLSDRLAELGRTVADAATSLRERKAAAEQVKSRIAQLGQEIVECHAAGEDAKASKISAQRAMLEGDGAREAQERVAGAELALQRARAAQGVFAGKNASGLLREVAPAATAAAEGVDQALQALADAKRRWEASESQVVGILRLSGGDTGSISRFPEAVASIVRDARRQPDPCPPPLPREHHVARVAAFDDPDEAIAGPARVAAIREAERVAALREAEREEAEREEEKQ